MKTGWNCMWTLLFVAMIGMMSCSPDERGVYGRKTTGTSFRKWRRE